jgi:CRISPR-associated exonuclease Cas4
MNELMVPLSALEHYAYCPRQAAINQVDGVWMDNSPTVRGVRGHRRVDTAPSRVERGRQVIRGLELWSERFGLIGRADAIELLPDGTVEPVEYKSGTRHGRAAEIQMCAQALCLEEMLDITVSRGHVWYAALRRRDTIAIDVGLRSLTIESIQAVREAMVSRCLPPAVNDARCGECQLRGYCLPELVADQAQVVRYVEQEVLACA